MKKLAFALVALALVACDKEKKDDSAKPVPSAEPKVEAPKPTFTKKPPVANHKFEEKKTSKMDLTIDVDLGGKKQSSTLKQTEAETKTEEILAVSGDAVTKMKVTYASIDSTMSDGKADKKKADPRAGKTYILEAKDGKVVVTGEDGKATVPVEASKIEKEYSTLGKPDPIIAGIPARTLKPGEDVPELAKAIEDHMRATAEKDMTVSGTTAKFREQKGDVGIFDVTLTMGVADGPMKMSIALKGEMSVRTADSEPATLKLAGPITISTNDGEKKMKMDGKGTMEMETSRTAK